MNYFLIVTTGTVVLLMKLTVNCDTCLAEDESIRLDDMNSNSISPVFADHDHTCQPFHHEDFHASSVQGPNFNTW